MRTAAVLLALIPWPLGALTACTASSGARPPVDDTPSGGAVVTVTGADAGTDGGSDGGDGGNACREATFVDGFRPTRTLYVAPTGSDANPGTAQSPWRTFERLSSVQPGDLVEVAPGNYPCGLKLQVRATATRPVLIRATRGPGTAVLDCGASEVGVAFLGASYVAIDGLELQNGAGDMVQVLAGGVSDASDHVLLSRMSLRASAGAGVRAAFATNLQILGSVIDAPAVYGPRDHAEGVDLVGVTRARLVGNQLTRVTSSAAIQVRAGSTDVLVDGNLFENTLEAVHLGGVSAPSEFASSTVAQEATGVSVVNNVVLGTTQFPFTVYGCTSCLLQFNTVAASGVPVAVRAFAGGSGKGPSAPSHTVGLTISSNLFDVLNALPQAHFAIPSAEASRLTADHNLFFSPGGLVRLLASTPPATGPGSLFDQDPRFVDLGSSDLRLSSTSPALHAGVANRSILRDGTGGCRTVANIGAY